MFEGHGIQTIEWVSPTTVVAINFEWLEGVVQSILLCMIILSGMIRMTSFSYSTVHTEPTKYQQNIFYCTSLPLGNGTLYYLLTFTQLNYCEIRATAIMT